MATPGGGAVAGRSACEATAKHGGACRSFALPNRRWCIAHDPDRASQRAAARARGGVAAGRLRLLRGKRARLDSAGGLLQFTAGVIHDTLGGDLDKDVAKVVLYGVSIQRQLVETGEIERRLRLVEQRQGARRWA
jgi:hypothetical protein